MIVQNKRIRLAMWTVLLLGISLLFNTHAQADNKQIQVVLNEQEMIFQEEPFIQNGTTFVQIRPLFEALGITLKWDAANRTVNGAKANLSFSLPVGGKQATVNGKSVSLDAAALIHNDHTMVPLRLISESADVLVLWDPYNRIVFMYGDEALKQQNATRESVMERFQVHLQQQKEKHEAEQPDVEEPEEEAGGDTAESSLKTPSSMKEIAHLTGMYYGYRLDVGGYRCGGVCWPKYTFLEGNKLFLDEPANGGAELIDCTRDECFGYTLQNGKLVLDNGRELTIQLNEAGEPVIEGVRLTHVQPVPDELRLEGAYVNHGYGSSATWTETINFKRDGTFTRSKRTGTYASRKTRSPSPMRTARCCQDCFISIRETKRRCKFTIKITTWPKMTRNESIQSMQEPVDLERL